MTCAGRVERGLNKVAGVQTASVNLATSRASVTFNPEATTPTALLEKIKEIGYEPLTQTLELGVTGMTCAACVGRVERALKKTMACSRRMSIWRRNGPPSNWFRLRRE